MNPVIHEDDERVLALNADAQDRLLHVLENVVGGREDVTVRLRGRERGALAVKTGARFAPVARADNEASSRYTPPVPREFKVSPPWVPELMFTLHGNGLVVIFLNNLGVLPGGTKNSYLLLGLGSILGGIMKATQYR